MSASLVTLMISQTGVQRNRVRFELTVPKSQAKAHEVKQGAKIKASYEERDGKKVVTSLQIVVGPQTK
jgi:Cu/Ag efflux protein CusF